MIRVALSAPAKADLAGILRHSLEHWGEAGRHRYQGVLLDALRRLRAHPELGVARDGIAAGLRSFPAGSHMIFYRVDAQRLLIVRILHRRMDAGRNLAGV